MSEKLLNQVLTELDYSVGELQRAKITIMAVAKNASDDELPLFKTIVDCIDNRIKSGKATMMLAGYTPISYQERGQSDEH